MNFPPYIQIQEVVEKYEALFFDAYGVLVDANQALPHAKKLVEQMNEEKKEYFIVTNASNLSTEYTAKGYEKYGLKINKERVISSGSLVNNWILNEGLSGCKVLHLGPESSHFMLEETDCERVSNDSDKYDLLIVANQDGYSFVPTINKVISSLTKQIEAGQKVRLLLPNPDLIYPAANRNFGMTGGMVASVISQALNIIFQNKAPEFEALGKPFKPIFIEAKKRVATDSIVMIGDQIHTDIKGAQQAGLDSVLIGTGLANIELNKTFEEYVPTYRMKNLVAN